MMAGKVHKDFIYAKGIAAVFLPRTMKMNMYRLPTLPDPERMILLLLLKTGCVAEGFGVSQIAGRYT